MILDDEGVDGSGVTVVEDDGATAVIEDSEIGRSHRSYMASSLHDLTSTP
jgi:hypothetical protein